MSLQYSITRGLSAGKRDCLRFDRHEGDGFEREIVCPALEGELRSVEAAIECLVEMARKGDQRAVDVEEHGRNLGRMLFEETSLGQHSGLERSLLLNVDHYCATIPWELVAEAYYVCLDLEHRFSRTFKVPGLVPECCERKAHSIEVFQGPLGCIKHLGLRNAKWTIPKRKLPRRGGVARALIVGDPDGTLDPIGHLQILKQLLDQGYEVEFKPRLNATRDEVLRALANPEFAVIYFFAHGEIAAGPNLPPHIQLADRQILCAADLPAELKGAPLVFLNCCWSAKANWSETAFAADSLAGEFLHRGASAVVGLLCRTPAEQGARAALRFFHEALMASTIGHALDRVRKESYAAYRQNESDLSWFAYRLYGNPDGCLATALWDADGNLREEAIEHAGDIVRKMEEDSPGPGSSPFSRKVFLDAATNIATTPWIAGPAWRLARSVARQASKAVRAAVLPRAASEEAMRADARPASLLVQSGDDLRALFGELLRRYQERVRISREKHLPVFPLSAGEIVSACEETPAPARGRKEWKELEALASKQIAQMLDQLDAIPDALDSGAAAIVLRFWHNGRRVGTDGDLKHAIMAAFLEHHLAGSRWVLQDSEHTRHLVQQLLLAEASPNRDGGIKDLRDFIERWLKLARAIAGPQGRVNERILFAAFKQLPEGKH